MTEQEDNIYNSDDEHLGATLHRLFEDGHDEIVIRTPTEGEKVVTRKEFYDHVKNLDKAINMSPADKMMERKRLERIANQKRIRLRTAMIDAKVYTVDLEDDDAFGKDVDGNDMGIDGLAFLQVADYLDGILLLDDEIGCFFCEFEKRKPIRIVSNRPAGGGD
ncbi:MAG: hypothetical protein KAT90_00495 [Gammaproteobacteria bacterium]|nr:hypothetical protein [Gammaproteobacteria bacterium]